MAGMRRGVKAVLAHTEQLRREAVGLDSNLGGRSDGVGYEAAMAGATEV